MDNNFWLYVSVGLPYAIRIFFTLAMAAAWTAAYFRWLRSIGVILIVIGMILSALLTLVSAALMIYVSTTGRFDPSVSRVYYGYIGVFSSFAPIVPYLLELTGIILIVFRNTYSTRHSSGGHARDQMIVS
jgi:hypothetical protein